MGIPFLPIHPILAYFPKLLEALQGASHYQLCCHCRLPHSCGLSRGSACTRHYRSSGDSGGYIHKKYPRSGVVPWGQSPGPLDTYLTAICHRPSRRTPWEPTGSPQRSCPCSGRLSEGEDEDDDDDEDAATPEAVTVAVAPGSLRLRDNCVMKCVFEGDFLSPTLLPPPSCPSWV